MKSRFGLISAALLILTSGILTFMGGCGIVGSPEGVLAGNWLLTTTDNSNLPPTVLNFDSSGNLTKVTFTINNGNIEYATPNSTTLVSEKNVTVTVAFDAGSLSFVGTLNDDNTVATGNLTTSLTVGGLVINLVGSNATLTKQ